MKAIDIINRDMKQLLTAEMKPVAISLIKRFCKEMDGNELYLALYFVLEKIEKSAQAEGRKDCVSEIQNFISNIE